MSRIFISHASRDDHAALALSQWLNGEGWLADRDIFLDIHPEGGLAAGQRWVDALEQAATRCEAVVCLISTHWLASSWCVDEYHLAQNRNKKLFALLLEDIELTRLPAGLTQAWQVVRLFGEPTERFVTRHPRTGQVGVTHFLTAGLRTLGAGLRKAGIGVDTFDLQPDPKGLFGWRAPYRGLAALEAEDAAVFFGRDAELVRGIDELRGLASERGARLLVILGASGAGKSSYLRAGLLPRLIRDDAVWTPLPPIRASRGGAIEGAEGLLRGLERLWSRFGRQTNLADLRQCVESGEAFVRALAEIRVAARDRALLPQSSRSPLPLLALDQAEELVSASGDAEGSRLLALARAGMEHGELLVIATIRTDAYQLLQSASELVGVHQRTFSLGPVAAGEIAGVIREPARVLRAKAGPEAPAFTAEVIDLLQAEVANEPDALPLLAFALERLMREHAATTEIGVASLRQTGGVARAIDVAAESALRQAGAPAHVLDRRQLLRSLFVPKLVSINRRTQMAERKVGRRAEVTGSQEIALADALVQERLLVAKKDPGGTTIEVAHEALLRRWPALASVLEEEKQPLLMLDSVLQATADWQVAASDRRADLLVHRGRRLQDAEQMLSRADFASELTDGGKEYLRACRQAEEVELREERDQQQRNERHRRHQRIMQAVAAALLVTASVAFVIYRSTEAARVSARAASSTELGARAEVLAEREPAESITALALGIRGVALALSEGMDPSAQARRGLLEAYKATFRSLPLTHHARASRANRDGETEYSRLRWSETTATPLKTARFTSGGSAFTATSDHHMARWDPASGEFLDHRSVIPPDRGFIVALSPTGLEAVIGRRVTAGSKESAQLRIVNAASGSDVHLLTGLDGTVGSGAFSADGKRLLAGGEKGARLWEISRNVAILSADEPEIRGVALSDDGRVAVTCSSKTVRIWQVAADAARPVRSSDWPCTAVAVSPDGSLVVAGNSIGQARSWRMPNGEDIASASPQRAEITALAFSRDGALVASASSDTRAVLLDQQLQTITTMEGHRAGLTAVAFSPDGRMVATTASDGTARIWVRDADLLGTTRTGQSSPSVNAGFSRDGQRIVSIGADGLTRIWAVDDSAGAPTVAGERSTSIERGAWSHDVARILTIDRDGIPRLWQGTTLIRILRQSSEQVVAAEFFADGMRLFTACSDGAVRVWASGDGRLLKTLPIGAGPVIGAALSQDDELLATSWGAPRGEVQLWSMRSFSRVATVTADHPGELKFYGRGSRLIETRGTGVNLRDVPGLRVLRQLEIPTRLITVAIGTPDAGTLFTADFNRQRLFWSTDTGRIRASLDRGTGLTREAAFSADGKHLIMLQRPDSPPRRVVVMVWDVAAADLTASFSHDTWNPLKVAFSPDGRRILAADESGMIRLWNIDPRELLRQACERIRHQPEYESMTEWTEACGLDDGAIQAGAK